MYSTNVDFDMGHKILTIHLLHFQVHLFTWFHILLYYYIPLRVHTITLMRKIYYLNVFGYYISLLYIRPNENKMLFRYHTCMYNVQVQTAVRSVYYVIFIAMIMFILLLRLLLLQVKYIVVHLLCNYSSYSVWIYLIRNM